MVLKRLCPAFIVLMLFVLLGVWGCIYTDEAEKSPKTVPTVTNQQIGEFEVEFSVPKSTFSLGEEVPLKLSIKNTSDISQKLSFTSGQEYEFSVADGSGDEIWCWSHDKFFTMALQKKKLESGEELTYEIIWPQENFEGERVPVGIYMIKCFSTADELREVTLGLEIEIVD